MTTIDSDATLKHVLSLPMVQEFMRCVQESKLAPLFKQYDEEFLFAPAATTQHHNFTHGLLIHSAEVWQCALPILHGMLSCKSVAYNQRRLNEIAGDISCEFEFTEDELFVAAALHDFAKIKQYEESGNFSWRKVRMICNQETWTLRECARHNIVLTDNELVALLHAEGGYTEFEVDWRPISVAMHAADLWSSQAMRSFWDIGQEMKVMCQLCGATMSSRNGPRGPFFGCMKYPACRGIKDAESLPDPSAVFLAFLKRNYPSSDNSLEAALDSGDIRIEDLPF